LAKLESTPGRLVWEYATKQRVLKDIGDDRPEMTEQTAVLDAL